MVLNDADLSRKGCLSGLKSENSVDPKSGVQSPNNGRQLSLKMQGVQKFTLSISKFLVFSFDFPTAFHFQTQLSSIFGLYSQAEATSVITETSTKILRRVTI